MERTKIVFKTSLVSIVVNSLLAFIKIVLGYITHSVAIYSDGLNNLSDSFSSIVTMLGAKLANKKPDKKHPLGYGRIEYMTSLVMAVLILYTGLESLIEAIKAILTSQQTSYTHLSFMMLMLALVVKTGLSIYVKKQGRKAQSSSLLASGQEAQLDAFMSASVLMSAALSSFTHISTEAYLACFLSLFILKAGLDLLKETMSQLLGERGSQEVSQHIKQSLAAFPSILGMHDLFVHQYGPEQIAVSFHIEVDECLSLEQVDQMERQIQQQIYQTYGYLVTAIGIYAQSQSTKKIENEIRKQLSQYSWFIDLHGVHLTKERLRLDVVIDFSIEASQVRQIILDELGQQYQSIELALDLDSSD